MCAQPWRAIDTLWGGAIHVSFHFAALGSCLLAFRRVAAMTSTGTVVFWLACRQSRCFAPPPNEGNKQTTLSRLSQHHGGPKTLTVCFVLPIASLCFGTESPSVNGALTMTSHQRAR
jgi:hypothetical protein